jgi:hypothetical protein
MEIQKTCISGVVIVFMFFFISCAIGERSSQFYVSADGSDCNPGTQEAPFFSLEKAKEAVRLARRDNPGKAVTVFIKGGIYNLEKPLVLTSEDSGSENAPVVYKAAEGEEPVFTGSRELTTWQLLTNDEKLELIPADVRDKIYVTDKNCGVSDFGDPMKTGNGRNCFATVSCKPWRAGPTKVLLKPGWFGEKPNFRKLTSKNGAHAKVFLNTSITGKTAGPVKQMPGLAATGIGTGATSTRK